MPVFGFDIRQALPLGSVLGLLFWPPFEPPRPVLQGFQFALFLLPLLILALALELSLAAPANSRGSANWEVSRKYEQQS
jgi:hypothetical protein